MTAAEALRKARATLVCLEGNGWLSDCEVVSGEVYLGCGDGDRRGLHIAQSSLVLDGFTVEELTEAGG